jgi:Rieske Fe-S protein
LWDTEDPYHYVRVQEDGERDILIVGGEDHRVGQKDSDQRDASNARFSALEAWTREHVTIPFHVKYQWSGQVLEPVDALGYAGRQMRTNTYIITGDSGMGMTNCTAGAMIVTDLILGRDNPWSKLYVPSRKTLRATPEYLKENLNTASEYTEYLTPGEISDVSKIPAASGAILRKGLKKLALYRDESGTLHQMSAVCPHLGCIVDWNPVEASWDCPCHGSRFTPLGEVMNGPALAGLTKVEGE